MDIENLVAVVRDDTFAPNRRAAEFYDLPSDIGTRHRDDFDGQRESSQGIYKLRIIDDADEFFGSGGDDLLASQCCAAAFDEMAIAGSFIRAIDIEIEIAARVEID